MKLKCHFRIQYIKIRLIYTDKMLAEKQFFTVGKDKSTAQDTTGNHIVMISEMNTIFH